MHRSFFCICVLAIISTTCYAQRVYFQQQVDYTIAVDLNPITHTLAVVGKCTYTNNSPETLDSIPLHLWANAYSYRNSPYAKQKRRMNSAKFAFAPDKDLGGYRDLTFSSDLIRDVYIKNPELHYLLLKEPLAPNEKLTFSFTYTLRVPKTFSRIGRIDDSYQITQWFPKPAVYDQEGWHIMPYLDLGEFYCEFGNYNVSITVPENGMVAATGQLVNKDAIKLLTKRINTSLLDTMAIDTLGYSTGKQTFKYTAENVHDFAFFIDPRFRVSKVSAKLKNAKIPSYAFYRAAEAPLWDSASHFLARSTAFADRAIGSYPHPQISAVAAPLGVGGGMEYPMITVIGATTDAKELDDVLAHEAFHNWFQGMLASNERSDAWMDEGLTSWLEGKYMATYYPKHASLDEQVPSFLSRNSSFSLNSFLHGFLASTKRAPAAATHSDSLSELGYGYAAYTQPHLLFDMLEAQLGEAEMLHRLQAYFIEWKMKHPQPLNLKTALGGEDVSWLFDDLISSTLLPDYKIVSVDILGNEVEISLRNKGRVKSPFPLAVQNEEGDFRRTFWVTGFDQDTTVRCITKPGDRRIAIDPEAITPELNRNDNFYRLTPGPGKSLEPLAVNLLTHLGQPGKNDLNIIPTLGYTAADKLMIGVGFHNYTLSNASTRYHILPQISLRDGSLNGIAGVKHSFYKSKAWWREIQLSVNARQYHFNYNEAYAYNERFRRATVGADLLLASLPGLLIDQRIGIRSHLIRQSGVRGINVEQRLFDVVDTDYQIFEADYSLERRDPIQPYALQVLAQAGPKFSRLSATFDWGVRYRAQPNFLRVRVFAGTFLNNDADKVAARLLPNGTSGFLSRQNDYTYQHYLINRTSAAESNQYFVRDGSLSLPFVLPVAFSDSWLISTSVVADLPVAIPLIALQAYGDVALYPDTRADATGTVFPMTAGFRVNVFKGLASVSFPMYNNNFVQQSLAFTAFDAKYRERIAFRIDLSKANPDELFRRLRG